MSHSFSCLTWTRSRRRWDKRPRLDPKDYTIGDLKGETVAKLPGELNGQQFIIQNNKDCSIFILDHTDSVTVDDCINCQIVIGPCGGRQVVIVFFRDCQDCKVVVACQQFRTRDCKKMDFFLCCATQPIIESSSGMKFACYQFFYPELEGQFEAAKLSVYNNNWSNIHDFTPAAGEKTWNLLPEAASTHIYDYVQTPEQLNSRNISTADNMSVIPLTLGTRRKEFDESCLVVFFQDTDIKRNVKKLIYEQEHQRKHVLVQTKEIKMKPEDVARIFGSEDYKIAADRGPVIGLEFNGNNCVQSTNEAVNDTCSNSLSNIYVSPSPEKASQDIDSFYNFVDMSMN
ncbi:hypothetical protein ACROYT_G017112 [Oculina patagonica]